jgi:hypothetical protein
VHALTRIFDDEVVALQDGLKEEQLQRSSFSASWRLKQAPKKTTNAWTRKELALLAKLGMGTVDLTAVGVGRGECAASRLYCDGCHDANKPAAVAAHNAANAAGCRREQEEDLEAQTGVGAGAASAAAAAAAAAEGSDGGSSEEGEEDEEEKEQQDQQQHEPAAAAVAVAAAPMAAVVEPVS